MKHIRAMYDGKQVVLLEPVDLPPNTPLDIVVLDDVSTEQQVLDALRAEGLIRATEPLANSLVSFPPVSMTGPPLSQTVLEERR